jgi:hypothetical protein
MGPCQRRLRLRAVALGAVALAAASPSAPRAQTSSLPAPGSLLPDTAPVAGRTYARWARAYLRWAAALPAHHAALPGSCVTTGERPPVWFLSGPPGKAHTQDLSCAIPAAQILMLNMGTNTCSALQHRITARQLERCAHRGYRRLSKSSALTVDGVALGVGLPVATGAMRLGLPAHGNPLFAAHGHRHVRAALFGRAAMLAPLTPGAHTITQRSSYHRFGTFIATYHLTVAAPTT